MPVVIGEPYWPYGRTLRECIRFGHALDNPVGRSESPELVSPAMETNPRFGDSSHWSGFESPSGHAQ